MAKSVATDKRVKIRAKKTSWHLRTVSTYMRSAFSLSLRLLSPPRNKLTETLMADGGQHVLRSRSPLVCCSPRAKSLNRVCHGPCCHCHRCCHTVRLCNHLLLPSAVRTTRKIMRSSAWHWHLVPVLGSVSFARVGNALGLNATPPKIKRTSVPAVGRI